MGSSQTGLVNTIGVTLLNPDGTTHTVRTTSGIYEIGGGCYGKNIAFPDDWKGSILWDTGGGSPVYAVEDYVEGLIDLVDEGINSILSNQEIRNATVTDVAASKTKFETSLSETKENYWTRAVIKFTSGSNEGLIRKIKNYSASQHEIYLRTPLPYTPSFGDAFNIIPLRAFLFNIDDKHDITDAVWDELMTEHINVGSTGEALGFVKNILGISGENTMWTSITHDANHNTTSATITQYTDNTLSVVRKAWSFTATYNADSELTSHTMVIV